jgi:hypothetical protein
MKKLFYIFLLVILVMKLSRTFVGVVGHDISNINRVEARYPDGLHYSTDETSIANLMAAINSARYILLPLPNLFVGNLPIQLYPYEGIEVIRICWILPGVVEIEGKLYLIVGEIRSDISKITKELHVEENNIGTVVWWRSEPE